MADNEPEERDDRGRFRAGTSGNPRGRPPKVSEPPRSLDQMLAAELMREVSFEDAEGNRRKGTQYEMICANIIINLSKAKPMEAVATLKEFRQLGVFDDMNAQKDPGLAIMQRHSREFMETLVRRREEFEKAHRQNREPAAKGAGAGELGATGDESDEDDGRP